MDYFIKSKKLVNYQKKKRILFLKKKLLENAKRGEVYKKVLEIFPDAELIDINVKQDEN